MCRGYAAKCKNFNRVKRDIEYTSLNASYKQCTSYHHYIIPTLHHTAITSYHHYIIPPLHHNAITSYHHYIIPPLHHTNITSYHHYTIHYTWPLLVVLPWESTRWRLLADSASVTMPFSQTIFRKSFKPTKRKERFTTETLERWRTRLVHTSVTCGVVF